MSPKLAAKLLATTLALSPIPFAATTVPAVAQSNYSVSFGYFHDTLAPYGQWSHHPRWGDVWHPRQVEADFRPYSRGHWDYTDRFGWTWASDYSWGDVAFHYGRWVYDPYDGWLWVPGYVWSPAWVIMRSGGGYVGWFPMPPDDAFLAGDEVYRTNWDNWDRGYGYADWYGSSYGSNWLATIGVFVDERHFADRDYNRYAPPRTQIVNIVNRTRNVTNYVTVNNYIVNRSVDRREIERASGRQVAAVSEREVIKTNTPVEPVNTGRQVQQRERRDHGGDPKAPANARVVALPPQGTGGREATGVPQQDRARGAGGPNVSGQPSGQQNPPNADQGNRNQRAGAQEQQQQRANTDKAQADQRAQAEQRANADKAKADQRAQAEQRANADKAQADQRAQAQRANVQRTQAEQQRNAEQQRAQTDQRAKADRAQADQRAQAQQRNADQQRAQAEQRAQAGQRANAQPGAQQQPAENAQQQPTPEAQQAANQRTKRAERKKAQE